MSAALRGGAMLAFGLLVASAATAQVTVGAGSSLDLGDGQLGLGCADLVVGGTLSGGTVGVDQARDFTIDPSGVVKGESATLRVAGDWVNAGSFTAGASRVELIDGCGVTSASVLGSTSFYDLDVTTASAKLVSFESGSTTTVTGNLSLAGESGALLQIRSTVGGQAAFLNAQGGTSASFVDVDDNDATAGNPIPLGSESVKGLNTPGWKVAALTPALGFFGTLLLAASLSLAGALRRPHTRGARATSGR